MVVPLTGCRLVLAERRVDWGERGDHLTADEARILELLASAASRDVGRDDLARALWRSTGGEDARLSRLVWRVRQKIEVDPKQPRHLLTVQGGGYRLVPKVEEPAVVPKTAQAPLVRLGDLSIDLLGQRITGPDGSHDLTSREAALLGFLLHHPDRTWSRDDLQRQVLGYKAGIQSRSIDNLITRLRAKLERDADRPELLLTVRAEGYRLRLRADVPSTLPASVASFIGRRSDLLELARRSTPGGIVTIVGPGGAGKTSLAVAWAHQRRAEGDPGPFLFVDLTACRDERAFVSVVATSIGMVEGTDDPDRVRERLTAIPGGVLVLDNLEQLLPSVAPILSRWVQAPRAVALVATSRERLRIKNEQVLSLGPLDEADAVHLFEDRIRALGGVPGTDTDATKELVRRLDGMPLPIEMAAGLATVLPLPDLLDRAARDLSSRERDRPDRHRSLATLFTWSWELLDAADRKALSTFAAIPGSFAADTAVALCGATAEESLASLKDKSLLYGLSGPRAAVYQAIKSFAVEHLEDATFLPRATTHFMELGSMLVQAAHGPETERARERLSLERDNLFWAFRSATDPMVGARLALIVIRSFLVSQPIALIGEIAGHLERRRCPDPLLQLELEIELARASLGKGTRLPSQGRVSQGWVERARALGDRQVTALALRVAGYDAGIGGDLDRASGYLTEAVQLAEGYGAIEARFDLALVQREMDATDATEALLVEAVEMLRRAGVVSALAGGLLSLATFYEREGQLAEGEAVFSEARAALRPTSPRLYRARIEIMEGRLRLARADDGGALETLERASALAEELDARSTVGHARIYRGLALQLLGRADEAGQQLRLALAWARSVRDPGYEARTTLYIAVGYLFERRFDDALARLERARTILETSRREPRLLGVIHAYAAMAAFEVGNDTAILEHTRAATQILDPVRSIVGRSILPIMSTYTAGAPMVPSEDPRTIVDVRAARMLCAARSG